MKAGILDCTLYQAFPLSPHAVSQQWDVDMYGAKVVAPESTHIGGNGMDRGEPQHLDFLPSSFTSYPFGFLSLWVD